MSTQKITSGSVTYFVCECGNPPQYCKCSELARIAHLEQQAARLANLPELPEGWKAGSFTLDGAYIYGEDATYGRVMFAYCADYDTAEALLALLNTCYPPAPATGQEEGKA